VLLSQDVLARDKEEAVVTAVGYAAAKMFSVGAVRAISTRPEHVTDEWADSTLRVLASVAKARIVHQSDALVCSAGPRSCVLVGGIELMSVGSPTSQGDSIFVNVSVTKNEGSGRASLSTRSKEFILMREGTTWRVKGVRVSTAS